MPAFRVLVLGVLVSGCFLGTPSFTVQAQQDPRIVIRVFDGTGLVTAANLAPPGPLTGEATATADPDRRELTMRWSGGVCHLGPAVILAGTAAALAIVVQPDAGSTRSGDCPAVGTSFGVTLTLSVPVKQDAMTLAVR